MTSASSQMVADTAEKLFSEHVSVNSLRDAEAGRWAEALWCALEDNGLTTALVLESEGGIGATWGDAFTIALAAGRHRAPVPLPETMTAAWLIAASGITPPPGPLSLIDDDHEFTFTQGFVTGKCSNVPWGRNASAVFVANKSLVLISSQKQWQPDINIAGEPRDTIVLDAFPVLSSELGHADRPSLVRLAGAAMRSAQMAGGMARAVELAIEHAGIRQQFGRPISKFQAIQHMLAEAAAKCAMARIAAEIAFKTMDNSPRNIATAEFEIATAKIVCGEAVERVTDIVHEVHGAIGFTEEHELHFITRRLWSWRDEFGAESFWAERLGENILKRGAQKLWPDLTARDIATP